MIIQSASSYELCMQCQDRLRPMNTFGGCLLVKEKKTGKRKGGLHQDHAINWLSKNDPNANLYMVESYTEPPSILIIAKNPS